MATSNIQYCTHRDIKDTYPAINEFDTKTPIYGWEKDHDSYGTGSSDDDFDFYHANNTGLVTQLYFDGAEGVSLSATQVALTNESFARNDDTLTVDAGHGLAVGDIIKVSSEYMIISAVSTNDISLVRGRFGTSADAISNDTAVYLILDNSTLKDNSGLTTDASPYYYYYDSDLDFVFLVVDGEATGGANPADHLLEAGEDFSTVVTQFRTDASRYLDSRLDPNLPKNQLKDKSGNFDYMIIRTTALIASSFMIKTKDPASEMATSFMDEADKNIEALNNGGAALSWQNTSDASKGVIRDVTYAGTVRPVDTRGRWSGTYDLVKVKIDTTGGAIGTATYSVWTKNGDKLGMNEGNQVVTTEIINGDYQALANGLQIRFAGTNFDSTATVNDTWEIEVTGWAEEVDSSSLKHIKLTRKYQ